MSIAKENFVTELHLKKKSLSVVAQFEDHIIVPNVRQIGAWKAKSSASNVFTLDLSDYFFDVKSWIGHFNRSMAIPSKNKLFYVAMFCLETKGLYLSWFLTSISFCEDRKKKQTIQET